MAKELTWHGRKRALSLTRHGIDFVDCGAVFDGPTLTVEDRFGGYDEYRYKTLGFLGDHLISIIHTEHHGEIRLISARKATARERIEFSRRFPD